MAAGIGKKTTDLPLFLISNQNFFWHSAISLDSAPFGWGGGNTLNQRCQSGLAISWATPSGWLNALRHLLTLDFPPSLKVALSLKLAMPHFIPGCMVLSDKTGVNSHS